LAYARVRRHRPRVVDLPAPCADAERPADRAEYGGQRIDLYAHLANPGAPQMIAAKTQKSDRPRVLVVDDYTDAREMYGEYLEYCGFEVVQASNGMEALQRAIDTKPDIILMDLSLPVMDGWDATRRL